MLLALVACVAVFVLAGGPVGTWLREAPAPTELPADVPGRIVRVDGHRVHVVEAGVGPPLVLVHGFGGSTFDYEEHVLSPLARTHHVVAVDLYGNGWSERDPSFRYGWSLWSDQLAHTLDALGIARASIAGHSMGGGAAAVFAARHPDRVTRLILADALYPLEDAEIALPFRAMATPILGPLALALVGDPSPPGASAGYHARLRPTYGIAGTRAAWLDYVQSPTRRDDLAAALPTIAATTLVLHGTEDPFVPHAAMARAAPHIPHVRIVDLEGGGHFPHRDDPERFVAELDAFLGEP